MYFNKIIYIFIFYKNICKIAAELDSQPVNPFFFFFFFYEKEQNWHFQNFFWIPQGKKCASLLDQPNLHVWLGHFWLLQLYYQRYKYMDMLLQCVCNNTDITWEKYIVLQLLISTQRSPEWEHTCINVVGWNVSKVIFFHLHTFTPSSEQQSLPHGHAA